MSDTLFNDKYTERQLVNSPAVIDVKNSPAYPDLMDQSVMRQKAKEWYGKADTLTSPDLDPEYHNKLKEMGPAPTDAYGFAIDVNGERLPDQYDGMNQQDRINTMTSMTMDEMNAKNVQYAIELHAKNNKAKFRDNVVTDMMGDNLVKDPLSGMWRQKSDSEKMYELGNALPAVTEKPLISKEELGEMGAWRKLDTQVAGGTIDAMINMARTVEIASAHLTSHSNKLAAAYKEGRSDLVNDPSIDSYALYGDLGQKVKIESDGTISGGLVRGFSQFLVPFTAGMRATSAVSKGAGFIRPFVTGFATDLTASQASDGNLADLFTQLGVENDTLKYMSATNSSSQLEAKLKIAIEGGIVGEGIGLILKGGSWMLKKTKNKKALKKTAEFLMTAAKAARRTNTAQVELIEKDASEIIANHLLEQYDVQREAAAEAANVPRETPEALPADKQGATEPGAKPEEKKPEPGAEPGATPEKKPEPKPEPEKPLYKPSPEVKEAYAQYALAKILKDELSPEDWMKAMKGKGHPELLKQSYKHAKDYINNNGRTQAYYHRTERAVIETPDTKKGRTADQWLQEITGAGQGKGQMGKLPADIRPTSPDVKWLGIEEFLKERKGQKVTKDELIQHIRANRVEIEDINKGAGEGSVDVESDEYMEALDEAEFERLPSADTYSPELDESVRDKWVSNEKDYYMSDYRDEWTDEFRSDLEDEHIDPDTGEIDEDSLQEAIDEAIEDRANEYANNSFEEMGPKRMTFSDPEGNFEYTATGNDEMGWDIRDPDGNTINNYGRDPGSLDSAEGIIRDHAREWDNFDREAAEREAEQALSGAPGGGPRWEEYNLDGEFEDYNELLLTMPKINFGTVESGHFAEADVIVHTRFDTRVDNTGTPVMFVEEVQSDYAKKGRDRGYESEVETDPAVKEKTEKELFDLRAKQRVIRSDMSETSTEIGKLEKLKGNADYIELQVKTGKSTLNNLKNEIAGIGDKENPRYKELADDIEHMEGRIKEHEEWLEKAGDTELNKEIEIQKSRLTELTKEDDVLEEQTRKFAKKMGITSPIPDAPVQKTEQWAGMAMRRLIRHAVDEGHTKIAWTTGDMQAERWGRKMGEAAKEVIWNPESGTLSTLKHDGEVVEVATGVKKRDLANYVGNAGARKLNERAIPTGEGRLPGDEIIVAEEARGYRTVYDVEIPKSVEKYVKQWKGKITRTKINVGTEAEPEWEEVMAVEFPEEMVKSARGGVPLLQLTPGIMAPAAAGAAKLLEVEGEDDNQL
jgi:hypothetical protein